MDERLDVDGALALALDLARRGPRGLNPQVGCVLLADGAAGGGADGAGAGARAVLGTGWHRGAGTPHAEVAALADARGRGADPRGATAVVTLEPCRHTGRTGPCTTALLEAGVGRVVIGALDPTEAAGGGAALLTAAGTPAALAGDPALRGRADDLLRPWASAHRHGRPWVTWKCAATLDGRSAAADGTSRWVTGPAARAEVHARRAEHDAVLVGTGTALADDPRLTVRGADGATAPGPQPLRAVMGLRDLAALAPGAHVLDDEAPTALLRTRDPHTALADLWARGVRSVWLEGGPTLAAAFLAAGCVDEVVAHLAPALLGAGRSVVGDLGITGVGAALRLQLVDVARVGDDVRVVARPHRPDGPVQPDPLPPEVP